MAEDEKSKHPAYRENDRLANFVRDCWADGRISRGDKEVIFHEFVRIVTDAGYTPNVSGDQGARLGLDDASIAVIRHTTRAMRRKLLDLHQELADEVRGLESSQER